MNATIIDGYRVASNLINELNANEVFVFGSNKHGMHGGGAAYVAHKHFGAEWGVGEGLTGQCYALPTMEGYESLKQAVENFIKCAEQNSDKTFLVTAIGCGIAGYTIEQVAPLFAPALSLENVYLPQGFIKVLRR